MIELSKSLRDIKDPNEGDDDNLEQSDLDREEAADPETGSDEEELEEDPEDPDTVVLEANRRKKHALG